MAFIPANKGRQIGDWVITTKEHSAMCGKFAAGSRVQIIEINPIRGYGIQDKHGNRIIEIGWTI